MDCDRLLVILAQSAAKGGGAERVGGFRFARRPRARPHYDNACIQSCFMRS